MGTVPPFSELIAATTRIAAHLETRDAYTPDDPAFLDWRAGRPVPAPAGGGWYDLVRAVARLIRLLPAAPVLAITRRAVGIA